MNYIKLERKNMDYMPEIHDSYITYVNTKYMYSKVKFNRALFWNSLHRTCSRPKIKRPLKLAEYLVILIDQMKDRAYDVMISQI